MSIDAVMGKEPDGRTYFMRCSICHRLYVPCEGINWQTGALNMYWSRPPMQRSPVCKHLGNVECWNGTKWVGAEVRR